MQPHADLIQVVKETIEKTVNGKIDKLAQEVKNIHDRLDQQDIKIAPAIDTIQTFQNGRKAIIWLIPIFAFLGGVLAFVKREL